MEVYYQLIKVAIKKQLQYSKSIIIFFIVNSMKIMLYYTLFNAIYKYNGTSEILGYTSTQMIWYFGLDICRLFENRPLIGFCDCIFWDGMAIVCLFNPLFCFLFVSCVLAQLWVQLESKRKDLLKMRIVVKINVRFTLKIYPTSWHKSKK